MLILHIILTAIYSCLLINVRGTVCRQFGKEVPNMFEVRRFGNPQGRSRPKQLVYDFKMYKKYPFSYQTPSHNKQFKRLIKTIKK